MTRRQDVGRWGEEVAAQYLLERGYEIVARNVRTPHGEIDLLARRDGMLIFIEVKARASSSLGPPEISVASRKQAHMVACAEYYAQQNGVDHWQIDVVSVEDRPGAPVITHFENAVN